MKQQDPKWLEYFLKIMETSHHNRKIGGEGGIRTLDTLLTYTPLAGERLQPLGHFTISFFWFLIL